MNGSQVYNPGDVSLTRCESYWTKVRDLISKNDKDGLVEFCEKSPEMIRLIIDHVEYEDNHPTMVGYSERTLRPLRSLEKQDSELHTCALDLVVNEGMKPKDAVRMVKLEKEMPIFIPRADVILKDIKDVVIDESVDLILTDPPYPREYLHLWPELFRLGYDSLKEGGLLVMYTPHIYLQEILRMENKLSFVWIMAQIHEGNKTVYHPSRVKIGWKPILIFVKGVLSDIDYYEDVLQGTGREKDGHEWQQSLGESEQLIKMFSKEGELVVDPFVGSGTTALAAQNTGRSFLVYDVDELAIKTTLRRLVS